MGFRADGTLWGISAKTSLFINPEAWSAQQGEEGVLEGKELSLEINEHTKEPLPFRRAGATGWARWPSGKAETHIQTHAHLGGEVFSYRIHCHCASFPRFLFFHPFLPSLHQKSFFFPTSSEPWGESAINLQII